MTVETRPSHAPSPCSPLYTLVFVLWGFTLVATSETPEREGRGNVAKRS